MTRNQPLPASLVTVAVLFIIFGILAAIHLINALARGNINLDFGVLSLFVGPGLLRLSRGWRTCGLVLNWFSLIGLPILGLLLVFNLSGPADGPILFGLLIIAAFFALSVWIYRVLTRPDIRHLFGLE